MSQLMDRMFRHVTAFDKQWEDIGCSDDDLSVLQKEICTAPQKPPVIAGTGGIRKIRVPLENRGKQGGARVLYGDFPEYGIVYLFAAYPKNVKINISESERKILKNLMYEINKSLKERVQE